MNGAAHPRVVEIGWYWPEGAASVRWAVRLSDGSVYSRKMRGAEGKYMTLDVAATLIRIIDGWMAKGGRLDGKPGWELVHQVKQ